MEAVEKAGEGGSPLTDGPGARCAIFDVGKPNSERVRIKNPRIYGFLPVGSRVTGWASLFYNQKSKSPMGVGGSAGLSLADFLEKTDISTKQLLWATGRVVGPNEYTELLMQAA